ncbi:MAG: NADPH:quinone reductase [Streptomycetales bacterium]
MEHRSAHLMRAARYLTAGPRRGQLEIVERERPVPGPGEVLVRVRVSGVNPTDWKARSGLRGTAAGFAEVIPNQDGAGEVEGVGEGVDPGRIGERVWLYDAQWERAHGTAAQWIALPSEQAVTLPPGTPLDVGAGLGIPAMTAHWSLFADGDLAGETVLVQGGAGAVGQAAIQLARRAGARVVATVSSARKAEIARSAGADLVVNYLEEDVAARVLGLAPHGVRRVVEVALDANLEVDAAVVADGGTISTYGVVAFSPALPRSLWVRNATLRFVLVYTVPTAAKRSAVADITAALRAGALAPLPPIRFPLDEIGAAHDAVEDGAVGKVLVDIP